MNARAPLPVPVERGAEAADVVVQRLRVRSLTGAMQEARVNSCEPMIAASFLRSSGSGARSSAGLRSLWPPKPSSRSIM